MKNIKILGVFIICISVGVLTLFMISVLTPTSNMAIIDRSDFGGMHFQHNPIIMDVAVKNTHNTMKNDMVYIHLVIQDSTKDWHNPFTEDEGCIPVYNIGLNDWKVYPFSKQLPVGQYLMMAQLYGDPCKLDQIEQITKPFTVEPDSDFLTVLIAIGAIVSASIAVFAVLFQYRIGKSTILEMQQQANDTLSEMAQQRGISTKALEFTEQELTNRLRPWVSPTEIKATFIEFEKGETVPYDEGIRLINTKKRKSEKAKVTFQITIKNVGRIPSIDVKYRLMQQQTLVDKNTLNLQKPVKEASIMPSEIDTFDVIIPMNLIDKNDYYVGLSTDYVANSEKKNSGVIWKITYNGEYSIMTWIS
jgi:hypothetical protein